jgi:hypothetical protein
MKLYNYQQTNKKAIKIQKNRKETLKKKKRAKNSEKKVKTSNGMTFFGILKSKRMVQVYGILLMTFAIMLCISMLSSYFHFRADASLSQSNTEEIKNVAGIIGARLAFLFIYYTFGFFSIGFVLLFFIYGFKLTFERSMLPPFLTTLTTLITMSWFSTVFGCFFANGEYPFVSGVFGNKVSEILILHTKPWGTGLILLALFIIILILFYNISPKKIMEALAGDEEERKQRKEEWRKKKEERRTKGWSLNLYQIRKLKNCPDYTSKILITCETNMRKEGLLLKLMMYRKTITKKTTKTPNLKLFPPLLTVCSMRKMKILQACMKREYHKQMMIPHPTRNIKRLNFLWKTMIRV